MPSTMRTSGSGDKRGGLSLRDFSCHGLLTDGSVTMTTNHQAFP